MTTAFRWLQRRWGWQWCTAGGGVRGGGGASHLSAYLRVLTECRYWLAELLTVATITVLEFPPRESFSSRVSLEFLQFEEGGAVEDRLQRRSLWRQRRD